jgi:nicotinamide mononucleotide (NMN) deamidase PncC
MPSCIDRNPNPKSLIITDDEWQPRLNNIKKDTMQEAFKTIKSISQITEYYRNKYVNINSVDLDKSLKITEDDIKDILDYDESINSEIREIIKNSMIEFYDPKSKNNLKMPLNSLYTEQNSVKIKDVLYNHSALSVVSAESLTAGMIMSTLVDIPICGELKYGCFGVYDTDAKRKFLGVTVNELYSPNCAIQMAIKALEKSDALISVAVTGNAAPGMEEWRRVGETFIAVAGYCLVEGKVVIKYSYRPMNACFDQASDNIYTKCFEWAEKMCKKDYPSYETTAIVMQGVRMFVTQESYRLLRDFILVNKEIIHIPKHIYIKRILNSLIYKPDFAIQLNQILTGKTFDTTTIHPDDDYPDKIILKTKTDYELYNIYKIDEKNFVNLSLEEDKENHLLIRSINLKTREDGFVRRVNIEDCEKPNSVSTSPLRPFRAKTEPKLLKHPPISPESVETNTTTSSAVASSVDSLAVAPATDSLAVAPDADSLAPVSQDVPSAGPLSPISEGGSKKISKKKSKIGKISFKNKNRKLKINKSRVKRK